MTASRVRHSACALSSLAPFLVVLALIGACVQTKRSLGEDCLKNEDCLSGICSQLQCAAEPPLLDAEIDADGPFEGYPDASVDSPVDAPADSLAEGSPGG